jgi:CspA family cold shock protein
VTGTVKWFNAEKGFGFIASADRGDLFVHVRALAEGRTSLNAGEQVYFTIRETPRGPEAANVRGGAPPPPPKPALPSVELPTAAAPASVGLRLVGRPAAVQPLGRPGQSPSVVAFTLDVGAELSPAIPKALPASAGATTCLVLVSSKHWRRVAGALEADPEDALVIDGHAALDPLVPGMITVRATSVATTAQLEARRAEQAAARAQESPPAGDRAGSPGAADGEGAGASEASSPPVAEMSVEEATDAES